MLTRLKIENFQKHVTFQIKFDPNVTAIVGDSDTGKSALLRAIRWLVLNRPSGDGFIREGEKECSVKVKVDGEVVERRKDGRENTYRLGKTIFRSFGTDVPAPVSGLLRLSPINFQGQHDPPFWFNLTAGEVAKELNEIVDLKLIDEVSAKLAQSIRRKRVEIDVVQDRLKQAGVEADELEWVEQAADELDSLTEAGKQQEAKRSQADRMALLVEDGKIYRESVSLLVTAKLRAMEVESVGLAWREKRDEVGELSHIVAEGKNYQSLVDAPVPDLSGLEEVEAALDESLYKLAVLQKLVGDGERFQSTIEQKAQLLERSEERLRKLMKGRCPLCGRIGGLDV